MISGLRRAKREREREREKEKEHEERLERVRSGSRHQAQTIAPSPDTSLSSRWRDLAARSHHRARAVEIALGRSSGRDSTVRSHPSRSHREIIPPPSRSNSFCLNLGTAWSLPLLDWSHRPWPTHDRSLSFSIYLSLSLNLQSLSLPPPSLSLTEWFCVLRMVLFWFLFL